MGNNSVAGIVGHDLRGIYKYCINRGNIDGIDAVGGIIGMIPETCSISVSLSYNTGEVSGRSNVHDRRKCIKDHERQKWRKRS